MDGQEFVGSRIRQRRIDQGLRQADVAGKAGISASYLNLIEHNKRRIGGKLLARIADILAVAPEALAVGADVQVLDGMRTAAARHAVPVEMDRAEDIAARFPGWAALIAGQEGRIAMLERQVQALTDRMGHDPALAEALHNVITSVTAIRATAGILVSGERVDEDWQQRFHTNLHADSQRLTDQSKALVTYLDRSTDVPDVHVPSSVLEAVEIFLADRPEVLQTIDDAPDKGLQAVLTSDEVAGLAEDLRTTLERRLSQHAADARTLPIASFLDAAIATDVDPSVLAAKFKAPLSQIFRRIAYLPSDPRLPPRGLAVCDAAGVITRLKPTLGFTLNRRSDSCPLWPMFSALHQLDQPIRREVTLPSAATPRLLCYAHAVAAPTTVFDAPLQVESTMLVVADPAPGQAPEVAVGSGCRICPRTGCAARREPALIGEFM